MDTSRPQPPEPLYHILLGNETKIQKQMKILKLKNINGRIHQIRKKCLIIQISTLDITWKNFFNRGNSQDKSSPQHVLYSRWISSIWRESGWVGSESVGQRTVCCHIDLFTVFFNFQHGQVKENLSQKSTLKLVKIVTFECDLSKTNGDTPPQSHKILQKFVWRGV